MSRLAKKSIILPDKVQIEQNDRLLIIKGSLGQILYTINSNVLVKIEKNHLLVTRTNDSKLAKAVQGTTYVLINNHIIGVTKGFVKKLQLQGVGYKAKVSGHKLELSLGTSHPIEYMIPNGIKVETPTVTDIVISGFDKQLVGQVAANIRKYRKPEPYKGKGVRYLDEQIKLKEAKKTKTKK